MKLIIDIDADVYDDIKHNKGEYINTLNWAVRNGTPVSNEGDLISRSELTKALNDFYDEFFDGCFSSALITYAKGVDEMIDNAPTVCGNNPKWCESCVSKGKCASTRPQDEWTPQGEWAKGYHEGFNTGTMLAEAFNERPQGEWKLHGMIYYCSECGHECGESGDNFCGNCGAKMQK